MTSVDACLILWGREEKMTTVDACFGNKSVDIVSFCGLTAFKIGDGRLFVKYH
jgi:sialic acid synthase SpsE